MYQRGTEIVIICYLCSTPGSEETSEAAVGQEAGEAAAAAVEVEVEVEVEEKPLLCRDEWPCDFCGSECFCEQMVFSER